MLFNSLEFAAFLLLLAFSTAVDFLVGIRL
jgi:hypothetical protein